MTENICRRDDEKVNHYNIWNKSYTYLDVTCTYSHQIYQRAINVIKILKNINVFPNVCSCFYIDRTITIRVYLNGN